MEIGNYTKKIVKLKDLKEFPNNPRVISDEKYQHLVSSLKEHGYVDNLVVNPDNEVIGGNQRLKAMKDVYGEEGEIEVNEVKLASRNQEIKLNIALNAIMGDWDNAKLKENILHLQEEEEDITKLGFDDYELSVITEGLVDLKTDDSKESLDEVYKSKERIIKCPKCGYEFSKSSTSGEKEFNENAA